MAASLKIRRLLANLSQTELGQLARVPQPYISLAERNKRPLTREERERVARALERAGEDRRDP